MTAMRQPDVTPLSGLSPVLTGPTGRKGRRRLSYTTATAL
jgi:hypothetical protein